MNFAAEKARKASAYASLWLFVSLLLLKAVPTSAMEIIVSGSQLVVGDTRDGMQQPV